MNAFNCWVCGCGIIGGLELVRNGRVQATFVSANLLIQNQLKKGLKNVQNQLIIQENTRNFMTKKLFTKNFSKNKQKR
jgi:hypothetical protein